MKEAAPNRTCSLSRSRELRDTLIGKKGSRKVPLRGSVRMASRLWRAIVTTAQTAAEWLARRKAELLPIPYFHLVFELSGRFYRWLEVRWFMRWVPDGGHVVSHIRHYFPDYKVIPNRGGFKAFDVWTRKSDQGHLMWTLVIQAA